MFLVQQSVVVVDGGLKSPWQAFLFCAPQQWRVSKRRALRLLEEASESSDFRQLQRSGP